MPAYKEMRGQSQVQLDGLTRENAATGLNEHIVARLIARPIREPATPHRQGGRACQNGPGSNTRRRFAAGGAFPHRRKIRCSNQRTASDAAAPVTSLGADEFLAKPPDFARLEALLKARLSSERV